MENIAKNIKNYVAGWNKTSPEAIKAAFKECCINDLTYTDKSTPLFSGMDQLVDLVMGAHEKHPGISFSVQTEPEYFDGHAYYTWGVNFPERGELAGHDFMEYNEDGLITRIVGFLPVS